MRGNFQQCEKEGCDKTPKHIIVDHGRGWMWAACDDHEASKAEGELSTLLPIPDPPP